MSKNSGHGKSTKAHGTSTKGHGTPSRGRRTYRGESVSRNHESIKGRQCWNCGKDRSHITCPATGKSCNYRKITGHFEIVCRSKIKKNHVHNVNTDV